MIMPLILILILLLRSGIEKNPGPDHSDQSLLNICHLNIRSILTLGRLEELEDYISVIHKFAIVALTETHLNSGIPDTKISIPGYNLFRNDRDRNGGGVALYVSDQLQAKRRPDLEPPGIETIWVEIWYKNQKLLVSSTYRPPTRDADRISSFLVKFQESIDMATDSNPLSVIILGDFNDRCTTWNSLHKTSDLDNQLLDMSLLNNYSQLILDPTRGGNILDLIFTKHLIYS
jgi:exonuclease III